MSEQMSFVELLDGVMSGKFIKGDIFKTNYGSKLYISSQQNSDDNIILRWVDKANSEYSYDDDEVSVTKVTYDAKYRHIARYEQIPLSVVFESLLNGDEVILFKLKNSSIMQELSDYENLSNFDDKDIFDDVLFYKEVK